MGLPVEIDDLLISSTAVSAYTVGRSLRFRSSASAYLSRTPSVAGNRQKWTWSGWVKLGALASNQILFGAEQNATTGIGFGFQNTSSFQYSINGVGTFQTTAVYRDPSAWYHVVFAFDSTQATQANRAIVYINNVNIAFSTNGVVQNTNYDVNNTILQYIGQTGTSAQYFDGYMAEVNFIDGLQLTPSSFGAYDTNGIWQPAKYTGSYGTNGFYLPFSNTSSTTTLVADSSGNGNNWTPNNISLTAGATYDSMIDSPTNSAASSNYPVMNPIATYSTVPTNGNLNLSVANNTGGGIISSMALPTTGKWYWEVTANLTSGGTNTNGPYIGIVPSTYNPKAGSAGSAPSTGYLYLGDGTKNVLGTQSAYGSTWTDSTSNTYVIGAAYDAGGGTITFYRNNTSQGTLASSIPASGYIAVSGNAQGGAGACSLIYNFGQQPFSYTPPTGFNALNTYNLPTPAITNGALYNAATLYTGTGSSQSPSNSQSNGGNNALGKTFYPDLTWIKSRSAATDHKLTDSVRGVTKALSSDTVGTESTDTNGLTAFSSTGFTVGTDTNYNNNGATYVGWQWNAGSGSSSSNTNGTITSTVSVNQTAGFSIVSYTGNFTAGATVGHGLGVAPSFIIVKTRTQASVDWAVYHSSYGNTGGFNLNATAAGVTNNWWNTTTPSSSVITLGGMAQTNGSSQNMIAYCFAAVKGYSAFGSYTGNGSTDGPFVYLGFRPRFIMTKRSDGTSNWDIIDSSRDPYNLAGQDLRPNSSGTEETPASSGNPVDFLSNGFKWRTTALDTNASGGTYIYAAFAENPFNYSRAR